MSQRLSAWIRRITDSEMPIFGRTVQEVVSVSEDDDTSAAHLGQVVLKDAAMTSRVLRLANSTHYNPGRQRMSTVSRAIMMLGFDTVRSMCLTVALIDSLVKGQHRAHLEREMARSLHAATQAQQLARQCGEPNPEEVFISALLYHIGDLAFWCFAGDDGDLLDRELAKPGVVPEKAQESVLGFTLNALSEGLAREWSLGELLQDALAKPSAQSPRIQGIVLSHQLAEAAEAGWETERIADLTARMAKLARVSPEQMTEQLHEQARRAAETSAMYGASTVARAIPRPDASPSDALDTPAMESQPPSGPDLGLQLQILRELTGLMSSQASFNTVVEMVMEGLHRGVGLPRVLFALVSPDRRSLKPKYVLGDQGDRLRNQLELSLAMPVAAPVRYVLGQRSHLWVRPNAPAEVREHITESFLRATGENSAFMAPVMIRDKPLGLFYGDGHGGSLSLDAESYDAFRHFTQQANLVLTHLAERR